MDNIALLKELRDAKAAHVAAVEAYNAELEKQKKRANLLVPLIVELLMERFSPAYDGEPRFTRSEAERLAEKICHLFCEFGRSQS